jgi:DNA invertase Pin-like site-specific DNA recombinase
VLTVWRLDCRKHRAKKCTRFFANNDAAKRKCRSLPHLIEVVRNLEAKGAGFQSLSENIDTTTAGGLAINMAAMIPRISPPDLSRQQSRGRFSFKQPVIR